MLFAASEARATGFTDLGQDMVFRKETAVRLSGAYRLRGELLSNLDLDRGLTPSGAPLFPVPRSGAQTLSYADMRFRNDLAVYAPGQTVAVKARFDVLDNAALGGSAEGIPSASATTVSLLNVLRVKRAYGEALTPFGLFAAGRMGSHWGLGMLVNGGDGHDMDGGDAADRIAFLTPLAGHIWAAAYDFSAVGIPGMRRDGRRAIDLEPAAQVRSATFAVLRSVDEAGRQRRRAAGKTSVEYGAYVSHRWQGDDVPATYLPVSGRTSSPALMHRGYTATAVDGWARVTFPRARVELEWASLVATVDQASLLPGALFRSPVTSRQFGAALESELGAPEDTFGAGVDLGFASGDAAPGFGAFPKLGAPAPKAGDLDGAQANPPRDTTANNFRFHPDYRIDRILFREIIGAVTDAVYARPHARAYVFRTTPGSLSFHLAAVYAQAVYDTSTPSGKRPLGVEVDPTLLYQSRDGFAFALDYAFLFPLEGLDNPDERLSARPAQLFRARALYRF